MDSIKPQHCRPAAFEFFTAQLDQIDTDDGLVSAATALSMHERPGVDPDQVSRCLRSLADDVATRVRSESPHARLAHLHAVLFDDLGLRGCAPADYYQPENSYLGHVLDTGCGIPISLSLIYVCVARRVGLRADGVNSPAHFMARVEVGEGGQIIDPFGGGRSLNREEAVECVARATGLFIPPTADLFAVATHRQWIERMIRNLINAFNRTGRESDAAAMGELAKLLEQRSERDSSENHR